jgi:DNA-binding IclR family transcriptional regulator
MARLPEGEKQYTTDSLYRLLGRSYNGLREQEIAQIMGMERRRLNNYLRSLQTAGKLYKEGRVWYAKRKR